MNTITKNDLEQKKHDLRRYMEFLNEDQLDMINNIIKTFFMRNGIGKGSFVDLAMKGNETNFDIALPLGLERDAKHLGMTFDKFYNISTYRSENHNCMRIENTAELFVNRLIKVFTTKWQGQSLSMDGKK
tara:strand:+ start:938 stop:1327 length:390 start_codon:yes stop_codon:yes gene_type:complete